jgi:hypothetical protein
VRLYNPAGVDSSIKVLDSTVRLFSDAAGTVQVASNNSGALSDSGTNVNFNEVLARVVRIQFNSVNGSAAALGEVEVIARGEAENTVSVPTSTVTTTPVATVTSTSTGIPETSQTPTSTPTSGSVPSSTPTSTFTSVPAFTSTSVPPTYTAIPIGTATSAIINTATFTPTATGSPVPSFTATNTQVVTALPSSIKVLALASLSSRRGTTSGSISSLGLLQQKGIEDDPAAYVAFLTPNKAYQGYQSFYLPGDITPSLISSMVLDVNYKAPVSSIQTWSLSIYNWKTRRWIKLGTMNGGKPDEWFNQAFAIPSYQKYISSRNEIRLQLRSNNGKGDLKVDFEVIKITTGVLPTATFTPTYTPSPTPTP